MVYLLQAEEREISYALLQDLALILTESPGVIFADATRKVRVSHGIMEFETREEAERVSARFAGLNFRTFVVDQLLDPPAPALLNIESARVSEEIEVAGAARVDTISEHKVTSHNWLNMRGTGIGNTFIPDLDSVVEEERVKRTDTRYYLDLFAGPHHWRLKHGSPAPFPEFVKGLALSDAIVGAGVRNLLAGSRLLPRFAGEKDYDRYLRWLYQLRYARH